MNAVGIGVSKGKSMVAVLPPLSEVRVIMEYMGRYYEPIAKALHEAGIFVSVVDSLFINKCGNNFVRQVKTDKADAVKIARYGLDQLGRIARI